jgi:Caudovirus prohead serine protease
MATALEKYLAAIRKRSTSGGKSGRMAGDGIGLASAYLGGVATCLGSGACASSYLGLGSAADWEKAVRDGQKKTVYGSNELLVVGGKTFTGDEEKEWGTIGDWKKSSEDNGGAKSLIEFQNVLTSTRKDRDGDILESEGAEVDPRMPLLWQHIPFQPIGRLIEVVSHDKNRIVTHCGVADVPLGRDTVVLIEYGALRISHGFKPIKFEPLKRSKDEEDDDQSFPGWHILKLKIMEVSVVSVPSNEDAIIMAWDKGKLTHPMVKGMASWMHSNRQKFVNGVDLGSISGPENRNGSQPITIKLDLGKLLEKTGMGGTHGKKKKPAAGGCKCRKLPKKMKGVIPYKETPTAEGEWNAEEARDRVADWSGVTADPMPEGALEKYASAFAYVLDDPGEDEDPYLLLHHDVQDDELVVIFAGVEEAMEELLDGDSGVPDDDKEAVYDHLAKHYEQFDEEAPPLEDEEEEGEESEEGGDGNVGDSERSNKPKKKPAKKKPAKKPVKKPAGKRRKEDDETDRETNAGEGAGGDNEGGVDKCMKEEHLEQLKDAMDHLQKCMKVENVPSVCSTMLQRAHDLTGEVVEKHKDAGEDDDAGGNDNGEGGDVTSAGRRRRKGKKRKKSTKEVGEDDTDKLDEAKDHAAEACKDEEMPTLGKTFARKAADLIGGVVKEYKDDEEDDDNAGGDNATGPDSDMDEPKTFDRVTGKMIAMLLKGKRPNPALLVLLKGAVDEAVEAEEVQAAERFGAAV